MVNKYTDQINWRRLFRFSLSCLLIFILFFAGPVNYYGLKSICPDGGVMESLYRTTSGRNSSPRLVLTVDGERYYITKTCVEGSLKSLQSVLQRRLGEHIYLRYRKDFFGRRYIVELDYLGLKLVDYDYAMSNLERVLKENAYVGVGAGLLYILLMVILKYKTGILKY